VQDAFQRGLAFSATAAREDRRDAWLYASLTLLLQTPAEVPRPDRERERLDPDGPLVPADSSPEVACRAVQPSRKVDRDAR